MAKSTCLKELTSKLGEKLKAAQKTFANEELLKKDGAYKVLMERQMNN